MGTKLSSPGNRRNHPSSVTTNEIQNQRQMNVSSRNRARSLHLNDSQPMAIPARALQELNLSSEENSPNSDANESSLLQTRSLPSHLFAIHGLRCPVCSKFVQTEEVELHFVLCLTKPRLSYNDDVLTQDAGECVICLEDLSSGDKIARLPCLCVYHKRCIDTWFKKNRSCPEHPS